MGRAIQRAFGDATAMFARIAFGGIVIWTAGLPPRGPRVFVANHCSNLDFVMVWANLPRHLRRQTRPVAAEDYWGHGFFRRLFAVHTFRAVLTRRGGDFTSDPNDTAQNRSERGVEAVERWTAALDGGDALIMFPEGTRNPAGHIGEFKTGLYHLCRANPGVEIIPVHLEDVSRALPKGERLPIPMMSRVTFGPGFIMYDDEPREQFLERARTRVEELAE